VRAVKAAHAVADPLPHADAKVAGSTGAGQAKVLGRTLHDREKLFKKRVKATMHDMLRWVCGLAGGTCI
jgi:hypothetical protein